MKRISIRSFITLAVICLFSLTPFAALASDDFEDSVYYWAVKSTILENFPDSNPTINYDAESSLLGISLSAPEGTALGLLSGGESIESSWNELIANMNTLTESVYSTCSEAGYSISCAIYLVSDANDENVLFTSFNGSTLYNVLDE